MVSQSTHPLLLALGRSTGAWIPNVVIVHMVDGSGRIDAPLALFILTFSLQQPESGNRANDDLSSILVFDSTID
jgi:hypothetical protein